MTEPKDGSKIVELAGPDRVAADWIARLDADDSIELRRQFEAWKDRSVHNREAAERLEQLWSDLDQLSEFSAGLAIDPPSRRPRSPARKRLAAWAIAAAASVVASLGGAALWSHYGLGGDQTYATALGKQRVVALADGSTVQLNTNALLRVHFTRGARDVKLVRGEAFFEVAPDRSRPFTVYAPTGSVQAVGTAFAVRVEPGVLRVTLVKGRIRVQRAALAGPPAREPAAILTVQGGAHPEATVTPQVIQRDTISSRDVARELSWRQGILVFDGEPLPAVIADVSRYTDVDIEIADPRLRDLKIAGYFDAGDVEAMLEALRLSFGVNVERLDAKHVRLTAAQA